MSTASILSLLLNGTDELWIGTDGGGAYIYNLKTKKCHQMTTKDGLPSNSVRSFCKDQFNRIMIATEHGLAFVKPNQPTKAVDVNYCYGLGCEYTNGASTILGNNHILLGTCWAPRQELSSLIQRTFRKSTILPILDLHPSTAATMMTMTLKKKHTKCFKTGV